MVSYQILFRSSASKELRKIHSNLARRILMTIDLLAYNPLPADVKKLKGGDYFRIRIGDYRVVYEINKIKRMIIIYRIRHRKDVYREL